MKAIVVRKFGSPDGLVLEDVDAPEPAPDEALVRVKAAAVNPADNHVLGMPAVVRWFVRSMVPARRIPGADMAGVVEKVGADVTTCAPGDEVFADLSGSGWGAFAEYATVPMDVLAPKPRRLSFEEAAAVPMAAVTALQALRDYGNVRPGQAVAVNGASGGVGTFAVQLAKGMGARVTGVCSTRNVALVERLGADAVIDYTQTDFTAEGARYEVILDTAAYRPLKEYWPAIQDGGSYVMVGGRGKAFMHASLRGRKKAKPGKPRLVAVSAKPSQDDLAWLGRRLQEGSVSPVIDDVFPLAEVPQALARLKQGHAQGKTVIRV